LIGGDLEQDATVRSIGALGGRCDALDLKPLPARRGAEAAGGGDEIGEGLALLEFVGRRAVDLAGNPDPGAMHGNEDDVAVLEADVAARVTAEQVVVHVERGDGLAAAAHADVSQRPDIARSARRVERGERGAGARDAVAAGPIDVAVHEYLVAAKLRDAH
jgi:hypothetical protein